MMSTKATKMLSIGIAAIAFLLATIPVFHSGVVYADEGDHGDHSDGGDHGDHSDGGDHGDHSDGGDHGDHDNEDHDGNND
jgi:hypothetical protein